MIKARTTEKTIPVRVVVYAQLSGLLVLAVVNYCDRHAISVPRFLFDAMWLWGAVTMYGGLAIVAGVLLRQFGLTLGQSLFMVAITLAILLAQVIALVPLIV